MVLTILKFAVISMLVTAGIALGLIASQSPRKLAVPAGGGLDFSASLQRGVAVMPKPKSVAMRDGWHMPVREYPGGGPLILLIHGSGWNGLQFSSLASVLGGETHVLAPDLRGHGETPERRGDVDYIGQMEDDLADLIAARRKDGQKVVLIGHSSGGGLVTRFAGGPHGALVDHAVLLAPFLGHKSPTTRQNAGGWTQVLLRRIIGLSMLNAVGITALNHLTIIQFAMPQPVIDGPYGHLATTSYSYRLNTGFAPRGDYLGDVAALPEFTLIVGSKDEAFYADRYQEVMSAVTNKDSYHIVPGEGHLGIVDAGATATLIREAIR
ncbi:MAG: alpha/beta hydrolase [Pseudomonadota bacterium]